MVSLSDPLPSSPSPSPSPRPNTPREISLKLENSYVLIASHEIRVPDKVTYVQTPLYETANDDFQGRGEVLTWMDRTLLPLAASKNSKPPKTCVLCGAAGIGKTQTALQYFHTRKQYFDVLAWVQADNNESLFSAFAQIAIRLGFQSVDKH